MANTRRIVMFNRVTADGYFSARDGNLDWFVPEPAVDDGASEALSSFDTFLLGRRTYEMFAGFWPHAIDRGWEAPHGGGPLSPAQRAMAVALNDYQKLVFSTSLRHVSWKNSRLLRQVDAGELDAIKRRPGKDLMILGSGSLVDQLSELGLIDEYQLLICPLLLGQGQPLVHDVRQRTSLVLLEARAYPSGSVLLRYARSH